MSDDDNFKWTEELTAVLVKQCYQKKTDFQNPGLKKTDLFKGIIEHFKELGHSVTFRTLYKKYSNIKGTYTRIIKNGHVHTTKWPYFSMVREIVGEHNESYVTSKSGHSSPESYSQGSYSSRDVRRSTTKENLKNSDFPWSHKSITSLLEEYLKRVLLFNDPKVKRKDLWNEIHEVFEDAGWDVSSDLLDRKYRILKNTYMTIKRNNRRPITWKYFDTFEKIYADPSEVSPLRKRESKYEPGIQETEIEFIKTESSFDMLDEAEIIDMYDEVEVESDNDSDEDEEPFPKKRKVAEDYHEARLSLERRKVQQLERMNDSIDEHLLVMKELLKVVKQKLR